MRNVSGIGSGIYGAGGEANATTNKLVKMGAYFYKSMDIHASPIGVCCIQCCGGYSAWQRGILNFGALVKL